MAWKLSMHSRAYLIDFVQQPQHLALTINNQQGKYVAARTVPVASCQLLLEEQISLLSQHLVATWNAKHTYSWTSSWCLFIPEITAANQNRETRKRPYISATHNLPLHIHDEKQSS